MWSLYCSQISVLPLSANDANNMDILWAEKQAIWIQNNNKQKIKTQTNKTKVNN